MKSKILFVVITLFVNIASAQPRHQPNSLFNPTAKSNLREMQTDRPDVTESAITVDAGHFQLETDLGALHRESDEATKKAALLLNNMNLKVGLTHSTAIQVGFESYVQETTTDVLTGIREHKSGCGNLTLRIKQNIMGNDRGRFAIALLPYIKFPVASYDGKHPYEGGLIVPMQLEIAKDWKLGGQLEVDRLEDFDGHGTHAEFLQSLTISHALLKGLDGIAETYYTYDFKHHHFSNFLNAALQYEIVKDIKVDGGVNYGIQKDALKRYFLGLSFRI